MTGLLLRLAHCLVLLRFICDRVEGIVHPKLSPSTVETPTVDNRIPSLYNQSAQQRRNQSTSTVSNETTTSKYSNSTSCRNPCEGKPCKNAATCVNLNKNSCNFSCHCVDGYYGGHCQSSLYQQVSRSIVTSTTAPRPRATLRAPFCLFGNPCLKGKACKNGGTCLFHPTTCRYSCQCAPGFFDTQCTLRNGTWSKNSSCSKPDTCVDSNCTDTNATGRCADKQTVTNNDTLNNCGGLPCLHGRCEEYQYPSTWAHNGTNTMYKCICADNWRGQTCSKLCELDCQHDGQCVVLSNGTQHCNCPRRYEGELCKKETPCSLMCAGDKMCVYSGNEMICEDTVPGLKWIILGACVTLVISLVLIVILVGRWMYRKRMLWIMKLVYHFQAVEENDDQIYDAFVSFKGSTADENFVVHRLRKVLEMENNYKLCLHFRDFVPGEAIADNIIRAIEQSRRTLIILSPNYISSEWCRLEYQKAQHEMLRLRHRIVPIIHEDISHLKHTMDKNLQCILDSVSYIKWPGKMDSKKESNFWQLLKLSMPKKRDLSQEKEQTALRDLSKPVPSVKNTPTEISDVTVYV